MTFAELTPELLRLHRGFSAEDQLTPDRLKAFHEGLEQYTLGAMRDGVTRALRDPRLPYYDMLVRYVDEAAEADRRVETQQFDQDAKAFFTAPPEPIRNTEWARQHHRAITLLIDGKHAEAQTVLAAIRSPANISQMVPLDGGAWLRANGVAFKLWPPAFCDQACLDHMGWPWPEWPASQDQLPKLPNDPTERVPTRTIDARPKAAQEVWFADQAKA